MDLVGYDQEVYEKIVDDFGQAIALAFGLIGSGDPDLARIVLLSIRVSLVAVALACLIGMPLGALLAVARFPGGLIEIYGMTEGGVVCMLFAHKHPDKLHTVGQPVTGHELIVLGDDDQPLPPGEKGVLCGRSPTMMSGYRNQPAKTAEMEWRDADGNLWLKTGDIGVVDADGFVAIVGRAKDMIISGGFNIYPSEIEQVIWSHPSVQDCAVIGVPDEKWGEAVKAVIEL
ncbi:MAG: AMP-binding protein, partial [Nitrospiraceae bacterium]|nr:AMP-binding protein [Nitrospiraceae bacterium]